MSGARTVASTRTEMAQVMTPNDANFLGKVFGGAILSMIDLTAYATASRFAGNVAVTASFDRVDFHEPIEVGEVVSCVGHVTYVGRTSMEVTIEVFAENVLKGVRRHTNTARVTMVAIKGTTPTPVPSLICESRDEKIAFLEGRMRREMREVMRRRRAAMSEAIRKLSDDELDRALRAEDLGSVIDIAPE